jgi:hypothetical protein
MPASNIQQPFYPVTPKIEDPDLAPLYQDHVLPAEFMPQGKVSDGFFSTHKLAIVFAAIIVVIFFVILYVYLTHRGSAKTKPESVPDPPPLELARVDLAELNQLRARRLQRDGILSQGEPRTPTNSYFLGGSSVQQFTQNQSTGGGRVPSVVQDRQTSAAAQDRQTSAAAQDRQTSAAARDRQTSAAAQDRQTSAVARDRQTSAAAQDRQTSAAARDRQTSVAAQDRQTSAAARDQQMSTRNKQTSGTQNGSPIQDKSAALPTEEEFISYDNDDNDNADNDIDNNDNEDNDNDIEAYLGSLQFDNDDSSVVPAI